nr:molybdate ABC transporter ATP-binding protein ModF [Geopsychrobacter electrodiphilus]
MGQQIIFKNVTARISANLSLNDITLNLGPDEHWAIVGANGSGKSSVGKLLCNRLKIHSGTAITAQRSEFISFEQVIEILDFERYNDDSDFLDRIDHGTPVREFILGKQVDDDSALLELAKKMKFLPLLERGIRFLSTGEMRKVVICKALLQKPQLLVLDEPFDGLDLESRAILHELISDIIAKGIKVVLLLNRFSEILPEITHIAYVKDCSIFISGAKQELMQSAALQRLHSFHSTLPRSLPKIDGSTLPARLDADVPLIEMRDVEVRYAEKYVLNKLSWTVKPGEHWQISGPNGAGKSTLLNLISGDNTQAYANDIRLFGRKKGSGESVWEIKKRIGLVSSTLQQNYGLRVSVTTVGISGFFDSIGVYQKPTSQQQDIVLEWLRILHMENRRNDPFRSLSYGEQRLVLLARAMVKQPQLLILDEPCQGLDDVNRAMVLKLIDHLGTIGTTQILYVTHHPEDRIPCTTNHLSLVPAEQGGYTALIEYS